MNDIKISVLIPSFNAEKYIEECVKSVINQTLKEIEIICIDAISEDNTLSILNKFSNSDSRIKIIESDKRSYGHQMNLGLDCARGQYIAIVESDDFIDSHMLEDLFNLAEKYDVEICKSTFYYFDDFDEPKLKINDEKKLLENVKSPFNIKDYPVFLTGHPSIWSGIYKNSFIKENNIKFIEEQGAGWVDNPFYHETALLAKKIIYRHIPYYYYRISNSNSSSNNLTDLTIPIRRMIDCLNVIGEYEDYINEDVLKEIYPRVFIYMNSSFRRDENGEHMDELMPYVHKMLLMLDESIIPSLSRNHQDMYYKFISPIRIIDKTKSEIIMPNNEVNLLIKENDYLYSRIRAYKKQNSKLRKKNKKYIKELNLIKNSKSYKFGSFIGKHYRKLKKLLP